MTAMVRGIAFAGILAPLMVLAACGEDPYPRGRDLSHYLEAPSPLRLVEVLAGKSDRERGGVLIAALKTHRIPYQSESYETGYNIVVRAGSRTKNRLVILAHYDRRPESPGANDNASCAAAVLEAARVVVASVPLPNIAVDFVFSDDEEKGFLGAEAFAAAHGTENITGAASFEMCGIGDAFGIWDVTGKARGSMIVSALKAAGAERKVYSGVHGAVPRFGSDHRVLSRLGVPAVGVTVLPREDENTLRDYIDNPNSFKWLFPFLRPTIFRTYHTKDDRADTIDGSALAMTARILTTAIVNFDKLSGDAI